MSLISSMALTENQLFDVVIIGGGPAGCQCGLWLKMLGYNPIILEKKPQLGGLQTENPYENHWIACIPGQVGTRIADAIEENIIRHGVSHIKNISSLDVTRGADQKYVIQVHTELANYTLVSPKIVIATGVANKSGGFVPSDKVIVGSGSVVQKHDFSDKKVAILGGGDTAMENYPFIKNKSAKEVKIFARTLRARHALVQKVPQENVVVGEFKAEQNSMTVNGEMFDIFCVMYGWEPVVPLSRELCPELTKKGFIGVDQSCRTSNANIFAIGECTQRVHPCVTTAMADGVVAAKAIQHDFEVLTKS